METEISVRVDPYEVLDWWISRQNKKDYLKNKTIINNH